MYARIEDNNVAEYPLSDAQVRDRFPNTSFPGNLADHLPEGYVRVLPYSKPVGELKIIEEGTPVFVDGEWIQSWNQRDKHTPEELAQLEAQKAAAKAQEARDIRNDYLAQSDWSQMPDAPLNDKQKAAWATYRQELRDVPSQTDFPDNIVWPVKP